MARGRNIRNQTILIVDDEYLIRWSLTQALSQQGYRVSSVENGKRAIEALERESFDFVITDLLMPELDGWGVLEAVQKTLPRSRVIIMTAYGKEGTGETAIQKGAWAYVEKPFVIDRIKELLNRA